MEYFICHSGIGQTPGRGNCEYCLVPFGFSPDTFHFEHILPLSLGGTSDPENLAWADGGCNGHKHVKTQHFDPLTKQPARLYHPRLDKWNEHFQWSEDETLHLPKRAKRAFHLPFLFLPRTEPPR
ncbi:MAG: HNH endonuclease [Phycisphaerae bacterium]|nr:HNH endonuclease [Saprospiraceae bacterium]